MIGAVTFLVLFIIFVLTVNEGILEAFVKTLHMKYEYRLMKSGKSLSYIGYDEDGEQYVITYDEAEY